MLVPGSGGASHGNVGGTVAGVGPVPSGDSADRPRLARRPSVQSNDSGDSGRAAGREDRSGPRPTVHRITRATVVAKPESVKTSLVNTAASIVDSKWVRMLTGVLTVYALFGDDIRLSLTEKPADIIFDVLVGICFVVFTSEVILSCLGQDDYSFSFFFILDIISTATLIMDFSAVQDYMYADADSDEMQSARTGRAARVGTKAGRAVRILRLIRVIKLYKAFFYASGKPKRDADLAEWEAFEDEAAMEATGQENNVSKRLSARMTQRTIILILSMLIGVPLLASDSSGVAPVSGSFAADVVLRAIRELRNSTTADAEALRGRYEEAMLRYIYLHGWFQARLATCGDGSVHCSTWYYSQMFWAGLSGTAIDGSLPLARLRQTSIEDFDAAAAGGGVFGRLPAAAQETLSAQWDISCSQGSSKQVGFSLLAKPLQGLVSHAVRCASDLRPQEMEKYTPLSLTMDEYEQLHLVFYFDKRSYIRMSSNMSIVLTMFICIVLLVSSVMLSKDANQLVLAPIEQIMLRLEKIRKNPLQSLNMADEETKREEIAKILREKAKQGWQGKLSYCFKASSDEPLETAILEKTIIKLGSLLALGFGEAGSTIVSETIKGSSSAKVNVMNSGTRVPCVVGNVRIRDFSTINVVLQRSVTTFVSQVAEIVHGAADEFHGSINRNNGEIFLVVWNCAGCEDDVTRTFCEMSIISFARIFGAVHTSPVLAYYRHHPGLQQRLGSNCRVHVSFGLHFGWAYQGALGTEYKIDAAYVSPHVSASAHVEAATRMYAVPFLVTQRVVERCAQEMQEKLRLIDKVRILGLPEPVELYCVDLNHHALPVRASPADASWSRKRRYMARRILRLEKEKKMETGMDLSALLDGIGDEVFCADFALMRKAYTDEFREVFNMGYQNYSMGEWDVARQYLLKTRDMLDFRDGPSLALLRIMEHVPSPEAWQGYNKLEDLPDPV